MLVVLAVAAALAGLRVGVRLVRTAGGTPLTDAPADGTQRITAVVPVLNEEHRLGPALAALAACGPELAAILVVDGGSTDGTETLVERFAANEPRLRLIAAGPAPAGWNGKAWNLETGLRATRTQWIATVDADACVGAHLLAAGVARLRDARLVALSVATRQRLPDAGAGLLHPAFLTTLVYRAGIPNQATRDPLRVQANGQVFVARTNGLLACDAIGAARASRCEDVTIARTLAADGGRVGFYEGDAVVRMHDSWRDCAASWPRSLTLRDRYVTPARFWLTFAELVLAQGMPLPLLVLAFAAGKVVTGAAFVRTVATALVAMRVGVLVGTRRAYVRPPWTYWLSPLADLPALALLGASALRRRHTWRGRTLVDEPA
ncbi:MAG TPA: glycosyltransferase family 2 protein [Candidatus Sulfotelmatobacter sp.]|nr:glycosyltransferase family 2 protein [Candidatus Sulfotelmatobacter sp.]